MTKPELEKLRLRHPIIDSMNTTECEDKYGHYSTGAFRWKGKLVIITIEDGRWHLSVSTKHPLGYYELKEIRYTFLPDSMAVAQIFPSREEFVNIHENCYHLFQID